MKRAGWTSFCLALLTGMMGLAPWTVFAQDTTPAPSSAMTKSPVAAFRELLAMTREERKKAIADRSPEDQKLILAKIREYEALRPEARELRLWVTELHWYLRPLMSTPPADRGAQLALIPDKLRPLIEVRLKQWDRLKPEVQAQLLASEQAMQLYLRLESNSREPVPAEISPALDRIRTMPGDQRRELGERVTAFFDLTPRERDKTLRTLSAEEQQQMERLLRAFNKLSGEQKAQCVRSFTNFAGMSLAEQQQFLKNADRWRLMKPEERQQWRTLVERFGELPPVPPGMDDSLSSPPSPGQPAAMATNGR